MIVTSGALVLVAIALLIGGLASSGLGLVWASIVVSLVSAVFLAVGVYQRRNDVPGVELDSPVVTPKVDEVEGVRTVSSALSAAPAVSAPASQDGTVLVVEGRPRYHVAGCRYLTGKDAQERSLSAARAEGFSACGVCKPDEAAAPAEVTPSATAAAEEPSGSVKLTTEPATSEAPARATAKKATATKAAATKTAAKATAKKATTKAAATKTTATKTAAKKTTTAKTATKSAASKTAATKATASKTAAKKTATKKAPAKKAAR